MENSTPVVDVCGKRTIEYIFECISKFNQENDMILLRAYGGNVAKGVEIAQILKEEIGITVKPSRIDSFVIDGVKIPVIEIPLECQQNKINRNTLKHQSVMYNNLPEFFFVNYSTYHLLLDWYLDKHKELQIKDRQKKLC